MNSILSQKISLTYIISVIAIAAISATYYGIRSLVVLAVAVVTSILCDYICVKVQKNNYYARYADVLVEAALFSFMLPASVNFFTEVISAIFMVVISRHILGSGKNRIVSTPATGYLFAVFFNKANILRAPIADGKDFFSMNVGDTYDSSSAYFNMSGTFKEDIFDVLSGNTIGAMGTNVIILLVIIGIVFTALKKINVFPAIGFLAILFILGYATGIETNQLRKGLFEICADMAMFTAVFIVSDPDISPSSFLNGILYGATVGLVAFYLTYFTQTENAPVLAVVLCSPINYLCGKMDVVHKVTVKKRVKENKGNGRERESKAI